MSNDIKAGKRGSIWWWIVLLVPVAAAIAGGISPEIYKDLKALIVPGKVFGNYMLISTNDEDPHKANVSAVKLKSHGYELWGDGQRGTRSWNYAGFINSGYLVIAYRSKESNSIGFGELFLEQKDADRSEFVGQVIGNYCGDKGPLPNRRIMQCNAILVQGEPDSTQEQRARELHKEHLAKPCVWLGESKQVPLEKCVKPAGVS